jgi:hypothetical protein
MRDSPVYHRMTLPTDRRTFLASGPYNASVMAKWVSVFAFIGSLSAQQPELPALLQETLRRNADLRLLDPSIDLPGGYTIDEIRNFGYWPPWRVVDLDHDKRPDVVATVVKPTSQGTQFGVLAVHAQTPSTVRWVVPLSPESLNGIATNYPAANTVMPLYCIECDSNTWLRWNGRSYEVGLHTVGDTIYIATYERGQKLGTFARPTRSSKLSTNLENCTEAKILETRGVSYETRWYFVEVRISKLVRGWIPASFTNEGECIR